MKLAVVAMVLAVSASLANGASERVKVDAFVTVCALTFVRDYYQDAVAKETDSDKNYKLQLSYYGAKNTLERLQSTPGVIKFDKTVFQSDVQTLEALYKEEEQANGPQEVIAAYKAAATSLGSLNKAWDVAIRRGIGSQVERDIRTQLATPHTAQECFAPVPVPSI